MNTELASLPKIIMTSDVEWEPSTDDKELNDLETFYDLSEEDHEERHFDQHGEYWHHTVATHCTCCEEELYDACDCFDFSDQVDYLLDTVHPEIVSDIYGVYSSKLPRLLQISIYFVHFLVGHQAHVWCYNSVWTRTSFRHRQSTLAFPVSRLQCEATQ
jgi:hypothetical protein